MRFRGDGEVRADSLETPLKALSAARCAWVFLRALVRASRRSPDWDHTTGGVMAKSIDPFDMPLHYTATYLQQFVREKAKKKARTKKR